MEKGDDQLSKLVKGYNAEFISADVTVGKYVDGYSKDIGKSGQLTIWESENLHPGQKYIRFKAEDNTVEIQTSCGDITISNNILKICTQAGANTYQFKLIEHVQTIDFRMKMPERYWHICNGCGKRGILSSKEAFDQGWDYPGPDGIYKSAPNYGFGMVAPRTCGNCSINSDKLYCGLVLQEETTEEIGKQRHDMIERIQNEPWSLLALEDAYGI